MKNRVKRFDFRRKLKGLDLASLKELKDYHLDQMLRFIGFNDKEADRQLRYVGYIEEKIKNLENGEFRALTRNERLILTARLLREKKDIDWQQMKKTKMTNEEITAYEEMEKRFAAGWCNIIANEKVKKVGDEFFYSWWKIYPEMPEGYFVDKYSGSPLSHTVFIINGCPLLGGKRALLYIQQSNTSEMQNDV